jgi:hypothetical protein
MAAKIDAEIDLHGLTAASARDQLETVWSRRVWQGLRRVRIIHGTGEVLYKIVRLWADDKSIPWTLEAYNPGVTILQPALRREHSVVPANRPFARHRKELTDLVTSKRESAGPDRLPVSVENSAVQADLFAQEIDRLEQQDPRSVHKRKHGL